MPVEIARVDVGAEIAAENVTIAARRRSLIRIGRVFLNEAPAARIKAARSTCRSWPARAERRSSLRRKVDSRYFPGARTCAKCGTTTSGKERMDEKRVDLLGSRAIINNKLARAIPELNSARRFARARERCIFRVAAAFSRGNYSFIFWEFYCQPFPNEIRVSASALHGGGG